jgi:hypothetical protein
MQAMTTRRVHRRSTGWRNRAERLHRIDPCAPSERDRLWAIETLREESIRVQRWPGVLPEDYGAYCVALASFVAGLRDPRAIRSLALATAIAPEVPAALAAFGDDAVDAVVHTLAVPYLRLGASWTLRAFLVSGSLSAGKVLAVERALTQ